jgi:hypothetical protein
MKAVFDGAAETRFPVVAKEQAIAPAKESSPYSLAFTTTDIFFLTFARKLSGI